MFLINGIDKDAGCGSRDGGAEVVDGNGGV